MSIADVAGAPVSSVPGFIDTIGDLTSPGSDDVAANDTMSPAPVDTNGTRGGVFTTNTTEPRSSPSCLFDCGQQTNPVVDSSVITSFYAGIALGVVSLAAFSILWKYVKVYTSRQHLKQVSFKPPDVPVSGCWGLQRFWGWLVPVLMTRTDDIYLAAGLDAVVMLKTIEFGVQIFTPMAMLSLAILVPVHLRGGALPESTPEQVDVPFKRFTIANLRPQSELEGVSIYWLHFVLAYVFVFYALWLMNYHYEDMVHLRRKNLVHGEDHHKYLYQSAVEGAPEGHEGIATPARGSREMAAGPYDDTMLETWKGYHNRPAFIAGSDAVVDGVQPAHVLHAPLEPSPALDDHHAGSETVMSINASMDLASTFPPDGPSPLPPKAPSVGGPVSTRTRRLLHAFTPGAKMQAAREQSLGLAFTDMIRAPAPVSMSRPLPSPPSGPGSLATSRALQRSHTGNIWDVQSSQSRAWRRSMSVGGRSHQLVADHDRGTPSPSPAATPLQPLSTGGRSTGGARSTRGGGTRPRPVARSAQRSTPGSSRTPGSRAPEARSLPGQEARGPPRPQEWGRVDGGKSLDSTPLSYMRPIHSARARVPQPSPRAAPPSTQATIRSPRSAPGSPATGAAAVSATLRSRHAPHPSFSDMVGHNMPMDVGGEQGLARVSQTSSVRSMPSFDRLSPRRGAPVHRTEGAARVATVQRQGSQPETPTLAVRPAPPPPGSPRRDPASRPARSTRKGGPTAESQKFDQTEHVIEAPRSPFDTMHPSEDMAGPVDDDEDTYSAGQLTASMQPLAPPGGGSSMNNAGSGQTLASHAVYVPPAGPYPAATPASVHFEVASNSGAPMSVRRNTRPTPLVIDNPADAVSVAASSHHPTLRYDQRDDGVAIDAVANDRTVVDAEEEFSRANAVAGMASETVMGVPSRIGVEETPAAAVPIQPLKWWVARDDADGHGGAALWMSTRKRAPRTETWYDCDAILSRKPSVRFRRTVDLLMPALNDEGEVIGKRKTAIEVHKYCVLVTDVPVDDALEQARKEAEAVAAERDISSRPPERNTLTQSALSMHAETEEQHPHHEQWHMWDWITRQFFARHHHTAHLSHEGDPPPGVPPPLATNGGGSAALRGENGKGPETPHDRRSYDVRRTKKNGKLWSAPPAAVAEAACHAAGSDEALLASAGEDGEGRVPGGADATPPPLSRVAGGTDLRHEHARERLAMSLLASQLDTANAVEGELAASAWRKVMAGASVPKALQRDLCAWLAERQRGDGSEASEQGLGEDAGSECWTGGGEEVAVVRRRTAGAVGEGHERSASAQSDGFGKGVEARRPSRAMSTHDGQVAFLEDDEAARAKPIAVDAAAAVAAGEDGAEDEYDMPSYGNAAREAVSKQVAMAFDTIFYEAKPRLIPVLNHQKVHLQLIKWDRFHQQLELVEAKEKARQLAAHRGGPPFKPVWHRTGLLGIFGKRVNSALYYKDKIAECERRIDQEREAVFANGISRAYFVVFETQMAATIAAQALLHSADARLYKCKAAPGPDDVNWSALWCSSRERFIRRILGGLMFFAVMCIPLGGFAGLLTELSKIACDALDEDTAEAPAAAPLTASEPLTPETADITIDTARCLGNEFTRRLVTQVLPAVLVILWQNAIMPLTLYSIALFEKAQMSFSRLDRRILMLFFWWDMFNVFFGAIISGSIVNLVQRLIKSPGDIGVVLGASLPESSNFFINYLALRAFGLVPFRLILVHGGIWRWLFKCGGSCGCVLSARDAAAFMASASIRYGRELGVIMLVFITAWAYAVVSPLVVVVSAIYFMSSWIVWRWQIVYVYVRCYEGGGSLWRSIIACFMSCLYIFVFFTSCVFVAKQAFYQAACIFVPLYIMITMFWRYLRVKYDPAIKYVPLEVSANSRRVRINEMSYIAAPLRPKCSGWHPEWGKAWESWGAPAYTA